MKVFRVKVAQNELAAAKVELIGELVWANELFDDPKMEGFGWFFFRGPDGNIYVILPQCSRMSLDWGGPMRQISARTPPRSLRERYTNHRRLGTVRRCP